MAEDHGGLAAGRPRLQLILAGASCATGDAAIEQVLSGIEIAATAEQPITGRRHRIEHCGFLGDGQIARRAAAGIDPVPQPIFMYEFGDLYLRNGGDARTAAAYPMRKWLNAGLHPAASSDVPVSTTDPFKNLFTMTTRMSNRHTVLGPDQALSMSEALHAYTYCGAYTQFAENDTGRLVPGFAADIAVLSYDAFTCDPGKLEHDVRCDLTVLKSKVVFDRVGELGAAAAVERASVQLVDRIEVAAKVVVHLSRWEKWTFRVVRDRPHRTSH
jgi:predicted amidohydrolase YtcJ